VPGSILRCQQILAGPTRTAFRTLQEREIVAKTGSHPR
jgi:hypothetical protein